MSVVTRGAGLSVVLICRNESAYIDGCLDSLAQAAAHATLPVEVLVVDGGSVDDTADRAQAWADRGGHRLDIEVVRCDRAGYSFQRNLGVARSRHPWLAFVSADVRVGQAWLTEVSAALADGVDLLVGRFDLVTTDGRRSWLAEVSPTVYPTCSADPVTERCSTVHLLARRAALLRVPFDERLPACEDKDLAFRLQRTPGWQGAGTIAYRPAHLARETVGRFLGKLRREAYALGVLGRREKGGFPDCFGWRRLAVRFAIVAGLAVLVCLVLPRWFTPLVVGPVGIAFAGVHPVGRRRAPRPPGVGLALLHVAAVLTVSTGYLAGWAAGDRRIRTGTTRSGPVRAGQVVR